jgi:hypothetical protein
MNKQSEEGVDLDGEQDVVDMTLGEVGGAELTTRSLSSESGQWNMMGRSCPRSEVKYGVQVVILYVVILTCLINLSIGKSDLNALWISLLSSCIGYLLPSPYISKRKRQDNVA